MESIRWLQVVLEDETLMGSKACILPLTERLRPACLKNIGRSFSFKGVPPQVLDTFRSEENVCCMMYKYILHRDTENYFSGPGSGHLAIDSW